MRRSLWRLLLYSSFPGALMSPATGSPPPPELREIPELQAVEQQVARGEYEQAEAAARAVLTEFEESYGKESLEVGLAWAKLVDVLAARGKAAAPETKDACVNSLRIFQRHLGSVHKEVAQGLNNLAYLMHHRGELDSARVYFDRAIATQEKALGPECEEVAGYLNNYANLLSDEGDFEGAIQLLERSLSINEKVLGPDALPTAMSTVSLAAVHSTLCHYDVALALNERGLAIRRKALPADHQDIALTLNNIAVIYQAIGDYPRAREYFGEAFAMNQRSLGVDHPYVGYAAHNLASVLDRMGDLAGARPLYEQALAITVKNLGPEHAQVATIQGALGGLLAGIGDRPDALRLYQSALAIAEKSHGPDNPQVAVPLLNLASFYQKDKDYETARRLTERAYAIRLAAFGPDHERLATPLARLASLALELGDAARADSLYRRSLAITEKSLGSDHPNVAATLLAQARQPLAAPEEALPMIQRALAIRVQSLGEGHILVAEARQRLAAAYRLTGQPASALEEALSALAVSRRHLQNTILCLSEREARSCSEDRKPGLDLLLALALESGQADVVRAAWEEMLQSRGIVLDETGRRIREIIDADTPENERLYAELQSARTRLANLIVRGLGTQRIDVYRQLLSDAARDKETAERELFTRSRSFAREAERAGLRLDDVIAALPPRTALVAFVSHDPPAAQEVAGDLGDGLREGIYCAFIYYDGRFELTALPARAAVDSVILGWRRDVVSRPAQNGRRSSVTGEAGKAADPGTALRKLLWDPLALRLPGAERVFVVPEGNIHFVNLAAFPDEHGGFLLDTAPAFHYLSSERDVAMEAPVAEPASGLLAVGAPDYDYDGAGARGRPAIPAEGGLPERTYRSALSDCDEFESIRFEPLPESKKEAKEVVRAWTRRKRGRAITLTGAAASEETIKRLAPEQQVLHLASHAYFLGGECAHAAAPQRGMGALVALDQDHVEEQPVLGGHPLLLSGIALAGANHRQHSGVEHEDGILTAEEISGLDLRATQWVVLSGCDTGLGDVRGSDGVYGLRRAFQSAGARTVIMSLWPVEDRMAREWMGAFYRSRWEQGQSTMDAARDAARWILHHRGGTEGELADPFYWAAFITTGDWR